MVPARHHSHMRYFRLGPLLEALATSVTRNVILLEKEKRFVRAGTLNGQVDRFCAIVEKQTRVQ